VTIKLDVAPARGLSSAEAQRRRSIDGANDLPTARPVGWWRSVRTQLSDALVLVLLGAAVLTIAVGDVADTAVILLVVVLNTSLGAAQEVRSARALAALAELTAPHATVIRDGTVQDIPSREVVRGDRVLLAAGDIVAADLELDDAVALEVDESALTGESIPVAHRPGDYVHAGCVVTRGRGGGTVQAIGSATDIGSIARSLAAHRDSSTPLQRQLDVLGRRLALAVSVVAVLVAVMNLAGGRGWEVSLVLAVSLAVAAIPESLPAVVSLSLAMGARRMARRGVLVRRLAAVEGLGSITVLAVDKTGTVTEGRMRVTGVWTPEPSAAASRRILEAAALCNDAAEAGAGSADPTETALVVAAAEFDVDVTAVRAKWPRIAEEPFDATTKQMTTTHRGPDDVLRTVVKGAPEAVLPPLGGSAGATDATATFAASGHRVLAVAERLGDADEPWRLLGVLALADPPRADAADLVAAFRAAGVRTVMITGDHPVTANAIAAQIGIGSDVHARVRPDGKTAIVEQLQHDGEVVAMTGDGVNDAPALRASDVGVAMGTRGTEVAKQSADLVLVEDDLSAMAGAIAEGRRVYDNLARFLVYAVSGGLAEILVMLVGPVVGFAVPLRAGQILWLNLLTHGLPGVAMGNEPAAPDVLSRPPRHPTARLLDAATMRRIGALAATLAAVTLAAGLIARTLDASAQSLMFVALTCGQLGSALALRVGRQRGEKAAVANPLLPASVALNAVLIALAVMWGPLRELLQTAPLSPSAYLVVLGAAVPPIVVARLIRKR
jgi:P-type Ca2+ transporter type 2C